MCCSKQLLIHVLSDLCGSPLVDDVFVALNTWFRAGMHNGVDCSTWQLSSVVLSCNIVEG